MVEEVELSEAEAADEAQVNDSATATHASRSGVSLVLGNAPSGATPSGGVSSRFGRSASKGLLDLKEAEEKRRLTRATSCSKRKRKKNEEVVDKRRLTSATATHASHSGVSLVLGNAPSGATPSGRGVSSRFGRSASNTLGCGACVAVALVKMDVFSSIEEAKVGLDTALVRFSATVRADQRVPMFLGEPGNRWHKRAVMLAVTARGYDFEKLKLQSIDLAKVLKTGTYLIDGVLNDTFVKLGRGRLEDRYETDPDDRTNPRANEAGWRHAFAVRDGKILEKEFEMDSKWLWLDSHSRPERTKG